MFEWVAIGDALPDCDETVLLAFEHSGDLMVLQGCRDDSLLQQAQTQWADAWALPVYGVTHWAHMPPHPADVHAARRT